MGRTVHTHTHTLSLSVSFFPISRVMNWSLLRRRTGSSSSSGDVFSSCCCTQRSRWIWRWQPFATSPLASRSKSSPVNHRAQKSLPPPPPATVASFETLQTSSQTTHLKVLLESRPRRKVEVAGATDVEAFDRILRQLGGVDEASLNLLVATLRNPSFTRWNTVELFLDQGFTAKQIITLLRKRIFSESYGNLISLLNFLKTLDVTGQTAGKIVSGNFTIASLQVEALKRRVELLESLGLERDNMKATLLSGHWIFCASEDDIKSGVKFLREFGIDNKSIVFLMRRIPTIFSKNMGKNLLPKIASLESFGASRATILKALKTRPGMFSRSRDSILGRIDLLQQLGIDTRSKHFFRVLFELSTLSNELLVERFNKLIAHGLSSDQVSRIVELHPRAIAKSEGTMSKKMDYLTKALNRDIKELVTYPSFLSMSLEKRIIPRFNFLTDAIGKGTHERELGLSAILGPTEKRFKEEVLRRAWMKKRNKGTTNEKRELPTPGKEAG